MRSILNVFLSDIETYTSKDSGSNQCLFQIRREKKMSQNENDQFTFQVIERKFESIDGKQNRDPLIKWYDNIVLVQ